MTLHAVVVYYGGWHEGKLLQLHKRTYYVRARSRMEAEEIAREKAWDDFKSNIVVEYPERLSVVHK